MNILVLLIPKSQVEFVEDTFTIRQTIEKMSHHHYSAIPVINGKGEYVGTIMGDMSKRRGRILGQQDIDGGRTIVTAEAPESEIIKYATDLKAMTQASGRFSRRFLRYDVAPEDKIKLIIEESKRLSKE